MLLHGIGSDAETWLPLIAALPATTDAIAWDAPGYGASAPLATATPTPTDYADALARLLDALGIEDRIALAGHSLGCLFAARFAAHLPGPDRHPRPALPRPRLRQPTRHAPPTKRPGPHRRPPRPRPNRFAAKRAPRLVHRPGDKPAVLAGVRRAMAAVRFPGYAQAVHALGAGDPARRRRNIAAPTLVAIGAQDIITPPAERRRRPRRPAPRPCTSSSPDSGHALPQEAPAVVAEPRCTDLVGNPQRTEPETDAAYLSPPVQRAARLLRHIADGRPPSPTCPAPPANSTSTAPRCSACCAPWRPSA